MNKRLKIFFDNKIKLFQKAIRDDMLMIKCIIQFFLNYFIS